MKMKRNQITIQNSIYIRKKREVVFDYTQDYENRVDWDHSVLWAEILQAMPNRIVKLKMKGFTEMTLVYKQDNRPEKTSVNGKNIKSLFIQSAGGSWFYDEKGKGTLWTQTNTITFKHGALFTFLKPVYQLILKHQTKKAMTKAKEFIEML